MAWTAEDRRRYAPAVQEIVRQGMLVRLAALIDAIDPPALEGRTAAALVDADHAPGLVAPGARRLRLAAAAARPAAAPERVEPLLALAPAGAGGAGPGARGPGRLPPPRSRPAGSGC